MLSFPLANGSYSEFGEVHDCRISSDEGVCWLSATEVSALVLHVELASEPVFLLGIIIPVILLLQESIC